MKIRFYFRTLKTYINYKRKRYTPFALYFYITNKCNLNCSYCRVGKNNKLKELDTKQIFSLIEQAANIGVNYISLTGGEPLLRDDISLVGKKIISMGMISALNTNGTLITDENAIQIAKSFDYIRISINGAKPETHDKFRGTKGCFYKTVSGLNKLLAVKSRRAKIGINFVVNERNYFEMIDLIDKFNEVDFINFLPMTSKKGVYSNPKFVKIWKEIIKRRICNDYIDYIKTPSLKEGKGICDAGKLFLAVFPNGKVSACPVNYLSIGDISKKNLSEIWGSDSMEKIKKKMKSCDGCYTKCTTEVSTIFRLSPIKLINRFPKIIKSMIN